MNGTISKKGGVGDIKSPNPLVTSAVNNALLVLQEEAALLNILWEVTEAYCPTVSHRDPFHYNGRAVDIAARGIVNVQTVKNLCIAAKNAGFTTIVNEYTNMGNQTAPECPLPTSGGTAGHLHLEL